MVRWLFSSSLLVVFFPLSLAAQDAPWVESHSTEAASVEALPPVPPPQASDPESPPLLQRENEGEPAHEFRVSWLPVPIAAGAGFVAGAILGYWFTTAVICDVAAHGGGSCGPDTGEVVGSAVGWGFAFGGAGALVGLLIVPFTGLFGSSEPEPESVALQVAPLPDGAYGSFRLEL